MRYILQVCGCNTACVIEGVDEFTGMVAVAGFKDQAIRLNDVSPNDRAIGVQRFEILKEHHQFIGWIAAKPERL